MLKQLITFLILLTTFTQIYSANVNVDVEIYVDYSIFNYEFEFDETESYRSFSFEKPKDALVELISSDNLNNSVRYSIAGDYFILNPKSVKNDTFYIQFKSKQVSKNIYEKSAFEIYTNFNFVVDELNLNIKLIEDVGDIETYFPRDYRVLDDNSLDWILTDIDREVLFRLEFSQVNTKEDIINKKFWTNNLIIIVSGVVLLSALVILVLMFLFSSKFRLFNIKISFNKKNKIGKVENKNGVDSKVLSSDKDKSKSKSKSIVHIESTENAEENNNDDSDKTTIESIDSLTHEDLNNNHNNNRHKHNGNNSINDVHSKINEEEYKEVMDRFLTDNEKLVVSCIRDNEGISQYDILNFLPKLTKSNLSKIISKLDNKKILKRIRVGKVNKIYLGNRFDIKSAETTE